MKSRTSAALQALFVVFLLATSWVFIKIGLRELPPLTFAGMRYSLAFLCLIPVLVHRESNLLAKTARLPWRKLVPLGLLFYAGTQGASFLALFYLPAVTVNLLWSFTSVLVALLGMMWLAEYPTSFQGLGVALAAAGAVVYFFPAPVPDHQYLGLLVGIVGVLFNAVSSLLGRDVNRGGSTSPLLITVVSMGVGGFPLLILGLLLEGFPDVDLSSGLILLWLAVVNTAFAFTLWNRTLRVLTAVESSVINGTMLLWIPILAVTLLGEVLKGREILGLVVTGIGTLIVQIREPDRLLSLLRREDGTVENG